MCLAVPGRVVEIQGMTARVDFGGVERLVHVPLVPDLGIGEYVLVHAGFAIQRMEASEAAEVLSLLDRRPDPR